MLTHPGQLAAKPQASLPLQVTLPPPTHYYVAIHETPKYAISETQYFEYQYLLNKELGILQKNAQINKDKEIEIEIEKEKEKLTENLTEIIHITEKNNKIVYETKFVNNIEENKNIILKNKNENK
jgi:hypothetical protein